MIPVLGTWNFTAWKTIRFNNYNVEELDIGTIVTEGNVMFVQIDIKIIFNELKSHEVHSRCLIGS